MEWDRESQGILCSIRVASERADREPFEIEIRSAAGRCRIELAGDALLAAAHTLDHALMAVSATRPRAVEIRTEGLGSVSALAAGSLVAFCRSLERWGCALTLRSGAPLADALAVGATLGAS